jgi:hypothetical protein
MGKYQKIMSLPKNFQFSQGSLQDYADCPRRFQLKYIEQLVWPAVEAEPALENEHYLQQGAAFHRLAQQHLIGVSAEKLTPIAEQDANLARWWENFLASLKNLEGLGNLPGLGLYPEFSLSAPIGEFRIVGNTIYWSIQKANSSFTIGRHHANSQSVNGSRPICKPVFIHIYWLNLALT